MKFSRRDILKGLGGIPVLGAVWAAGASSTTQKKREKEAILETLKIDPAVPPKSGDLSGDPVRVGICGYGIRGQQLCKALGYASNTWIDAMQKNAAKNPNDTRLKEYMEQEDLNVRITGVVDMFDVRADLAIESFTTDKNKPKRYATHQEMINSGEVDAVIIATPDHWHAPIAIDALNAGVHAYVEKPMTHTIAETYELKEAAERSKAVLAVGHQHRQTQSFLTAQEVVKEGVLGHVSLVTTNTNRK